MDVDQHVKDYLIKSLKFNENLVNGTFEFIDGYRQRSLGKRALEVEMRIMESTKDDI